jgi:hypothetical protein
VAAAALSAAGAARADVSLSFGVGGPTYYEPAPVYQAPPPVYQAPPPVYYQPPPVYYQPAPPPPVYYRPAPGYYGPPPAYYAPAPAYRYQGQGHPQQPRLSDMQQRALDNCVLLPANEQRRCRSTVYSTTR